MNILKLWTWVSDWRTILRKAWSVKLMLLAGVLAGLEAILPLFMPRDPPWWWSLLVFSVVCAALISRFVAQPGMKDDKE